MLSSRGTDWAKVGYLHGKENPYDPVHNPDGTVYMFNSFNVDVHECLLTYGEGYTGTVALRTAMANHLNVYFQPAQPIGPEEITFAAGVTDINEACALVTCNPGESIMLGRPNYSSFSKDLVMRTGVKLEYVSFGEVDQFSPACVELFDEAFETATAKGAIIKTLLICNPHNPLGQCYTREALEGLLRFCASKSIHLISDEIYALSTYNQDSEASERFTSVRSIDPTGIIDPSQVHVLYGMSKVEDYGAAGLRLGCVISQNEDFTKAVRATCRFSSPSQFSMFIATKFLENQSFVKEFLATSQRRLYQNRLLVENLLDQVGIDYHRRGNAGLFLWLDLTAHLPLSETGGDGWAAERLLSERFTKAGVVIDPGVIYSAPRPGRFRLVFTVDEATAREGIHRIASVLSKE
ncbi:hypothetical protein jhhlp_000158 [Lomentospora prolificans]|uniref:Aminotransferase class I/classII large domain-containing protein n=1 Tax=Lomentospora prolificans TaxID=41688 RepID=A0A2N3NLT7_9PEZI|nr:hypothetical protein jhhlp_000158 [Lomentospora prolificans]